MATDDGGMGEERRYGGQQGSTGWSDVPITVKVLSPSTASEASQRTLSQDYFMMHTADASDALARTTSITASSTAPTGASEVNAAGSIQVPEPGSRLHAQERRPPAQSHSSAMSMESTATLRPPSNMTGSVSAPPATNPTHPPTGVRPVFPNQSYAALENQKYPLAQLHATGSRTAGNSPAVTPGVGLYNPNTTHPEENYESPDTPGTYASPFLHFTHRQAPKETHVADVDVDPVSGRKLINHYEVVDELGRGAHGKVKLGRDLLSAEGTYVAIKIVERYSKRRKLGKLVSAAEDKVKKEVAILKKVRHPNVVALLEVIDDPTRKKVYIVLEYVARGEIKWRARAPREIAIVEARRYERERSERHSAQANAEAEAVEMEAQRRLHREKRRQHREHHAWLRRRHHEQPDDPHFSHFNADDESDQSDDDRMSRVSTSTAPDSRNASRLFSDTRRGSRAVSPLPPHSAVSSPVEHVREHASPINNDAFTTSPLDPHLPKGVGLFTTGLEGTMYGAYDANSPATSRVHSDANSEVDLGQLANEILDSELHPELLYVPVMTLQQARVAFRDTLLGLQYLHYQGIVHRDIKPPNLLETYDRRVKISDFGVSYLGRPRDADEPSEDVSEHEAQDFDEAKELAKTVGTPAFYAPELCTVDPGDDPMPVTKAIDVWALGITLFCMLFARTPFVDAEYVVMRQIADEDIYIPRQRLRPVDEQPTSRPPSHSRAGTPIAGSKRHELDLAYEAIDDSLHDLLQGLLTKDPRQRIALEDVRHHPWVLADLQNKAGWLEETDPGRQSKGKKIEVSNEDVKTAVIPLQFLDRVRSGIKKVTDRLGLSSASSSSKPPSRGRAQSSVGNGSDASPLNSPVGSATSSSTTLNHDGRRSSLRGDEGSILPALKASRQGEHPLSRSVAASPEHDRTAYFLDAQIEETDFADTPQNLTPQVSPPRPNMPERSKTIMSTATSVKTIRQADMTRGRRASPPPSPGLPGTPVALESPGGSGLQAILGSGAARRAFKALRERSTPRPSGGRAPSLDRLSINSYDAHGEPTLALSQTSAEGQVNLPQALQELGQQDSRPGSVQNSPVASRASSIVASPRDMHGRPSDFSRTASSRSMQSVSAMNTVVEEDRPVSGQVRAIAGSSTEDWQRADAERIRKLIRESQEAAERPIADAFVDRTCPPSPDDNATRRRPSRQIDALIEASEPLSPHHRTNPRDRIAQLPPAMVSSSSDFGSAVSMSISNPSIPSAISEASSFDPADGLPMNHHHLPEKRTDSSSDGTLNPAPTEPPDEAVDDGYTPETEQALSSDNEDDYDSSSDSDGGLVMRRRKSKSSATAANAGLGSSGTTGPAMPDPSPARSHRRTATALSPPSKKSSRSGSNATMKKVRTRDSEEERRRGSLELREED
ncbi:hypothetical protein LTR62_005646 [Meristemomyces frigidus]|uniref:non-specific serine/threonine protein kinase n=1 Tax=Meristemomyces frigidus TaxID=1508187 RepID=A0AAN7TKR6_9PEZI|nr:hypothetical protein LTR62_005646 [Meristemomyces frigidus]